MVELGSASSSGACDWEDGGKYRRRDVLQGKRHHHGDEKADQEECCWRCVKCQTGLLEGLRAEREEAGSPRERWAGKVANEGHALHMVDEAEKEIEQ